MASITRSPVPALAGVCCFAPRVPRGAYGRQLAQQVRSLLPRIRTLFISGYAYEVGDNQREFSAEDAFIAKPFTPAVFVGKIQEVLQPNQTAIDDDRAKFPDLAQLSRVRQLSAAEVNSLLATQEPLMLLDVRELNEYSGELGHIRGSTLIPLRELAERSAELENCKSKTVIAICRSGVRSTTAAAMPSHTERSSLSVSSADAYAPIPKNAA